MMDGEYESATALVIMLTQNHETEVEEDFEDIYQQTKNKSSRKNIVSQIHQELIDQNCPIHDPSNALVINRTLKDQLLEYRQHLEACLEKVQKQFQKNRDYLAKCKKFTRYSSTSYYHKCAPYFKDPQFNFAPNNADYVYRKVVLKEFFASDLVRVKRWKMSEKIALVNNVRDQIIEHLKSKMLLGESKNMKTRKSLSKQKKIAAGDNFRKMPLLELWRKVQSDETSTFEINWESVTFNAVEDNHNVFECEGIWNASLRPDLSREQWTDEENDQLINAVKFYSNENWDLIAAELSGRSSLMCFLHYALHFVEAPAFNVRWTPDEDSLLAEAIEACTHCGIVNWKRVSLLVPNRSRTQCYNRATDGVGPGLKRGCFSKEENQMILEWVDKNGSDFRTFPESILPARSLKQIRMHYNLALKHDGNINSWTKEEDKILMDFVEKEGQKKWLQIATILTTHCRSSCRTRYLTIQGYLSKHPTKTLADVPIKKKTITAVDKARGRVPIKVVVLKDKKNSRKQVQEMEDFLSTESMLFELFRYSFQYSMEREPKPITETSTKAESVIVELLETNISEIANRISFLTLHQSNKFFKMMNLFLDKDLTGDIKRYERTKKLNFVFPPCWNSIVGLRGIAIKCNTFSEVKDQEPKKTIFKYKNIELKGQIKLFKKRFHSLFYLTAMLAKLNLGVLTEITQKHNPSITTQGFVVQYVDDNLQPQPSTTVPDFTGYATSSSQDSPQVVQILGTVNIPPDASYSVVLDHNTNYLNNISISHKRFPEDQIDGNCSKKLKE